MNKNQYQCSLREKIWQTQSACVLLFAIFLQNLSAQTVTGEKAGIPPIPSVYHSEPFFKSDELKW
jgi:hypothetical protein